MHPIAFLALLTIAMLVLAALRLEFDFRRTSSEDSAPEPSSEPDRGPRPPELRAAPAGGYWQAPPPPRPLAGAGQPRRAGFAL